MQNITNAPASLLAEKEARDKSFRKKGILTALFSGFLYGGTGIAAGITAFALVYTLSALGAAVNDICSGVWSLIYGGPIASTCYVISLQMAGSIIVPIAALNAAIGALYGRIRYKQELSGGMILGIVICFAAAVLIGSSSMTGLSFSGKAALGMLAAFCAALGWGIEGAVGGYACCIADYEVAIIIRQVTAGFVNGVILVSLLSMIGGDGIGSGFAWLGAALTDGPSIWMFFIAGMFASF